MSLKFRLLSFLSRNTLSQKHDAGVLFTWAHVKYNRRRTCHRFSGTRPIFMSKSTVTVKIKTPILDLDMFIYSKEYI